MGFQTLQRVFVSLDLYEALGNEGDLVRPELVDEGRLADLGIADDDHGGVVPGAHPHDDVSAHCVSPCFSLKTRHLTEPSDQGPV